MELTFDAMSTSVEEVGPHNMLLQAILDEMGQNICIDCVRSAMMLADFSQLASSTMKHERHSRPRKKA